MSRHKVSAIACWLFGRFLTIDLTLTVLPTLNFMQPLRTWSANLDYAWRSMIQALRTILDVTLIILYHSRSPNGGCKSS